MKTCLQNEGVLFFKEVKCVSLPEMRENWDVWEGRVAKWWGHTELCCKVRHENMLEGFMGGLSEREGSE